MEDEQKVGNFRNNPVVVDWPRGPVASALYDLR